MANDKTTSRTDERTGWTFLSNHAHVLICLARDRDARLRDVAEQVGITERSVVKIINELEEAGAVTRHREGRRNHYEINTQLQLRHTLEADCDVGTLLEMALSAAQARALGLRKRTRRSG